MADDKIYSGFLGRWRLDTEQSQYEQGAAPLSGELHIVEEDDGIAFHMTQTDADGETATLTFRGKPDGGRQPFNGGLLADEISVIAKSSDQLDTIAYRKGEALMTAERRLVSDGQRLNVTQTVKISDHEQPQNRQVFVRLPLSDA